MCSLDQRGRVPVFALIPLSLLPVLSSPRLSALLLFRFPDEGHTAIGDSDDDDDDHDDRHNDVVRSGGSHFVLLGRQAQTN